MAEPLVTRARAGDEKGGPMRGRPSFRASSDYQLPLQFVAPVASTLPSVVPGPVASSRMQYGCPDALRVLISTVLPLAVLTVTVLSAALPSVSVQVIEGSIPDATPLAVNPV